MRILVVNNGSGYLKNIIGRIEKSEHSYSVIDYKQNLKIDDSSYDLAILSGGMNPEAYEKDVNGIYYYQSQMNFIKSSKIPILGICLGLQIMALAFNGNMKKLPVMVHCDKKVKLTRSLNDILNKDRVLVHVRHQWVVKNIENEFDICGMSEEGIEIIKHKNKKIVGVQFHPEVDTNEFSEKVFWDLAYFVLKK